MSKMKASGGGAGDSPGVVTMNPLAPAPGGFVTANLGAMLGTAPVVNGKSGLVQVFAPSVATTRNV